MNYCQCQLKKGRLLSTAWIPEQSALKFYKSTRKSIPFSGLRFYKRCGWSTIKLIHEYKPNNAKYN